MANSAALELILELSGNADKQLASIQRELQGTQHQMEAAQKSAGFFGNILAGATGGLITSGIDAISSHFSDFISSGISDAQGAIGLMSQTQAVLTSTGNAAGVTAEHIAEYASSLSDATGKSLFGDDQIQQSENLLLTFTNIKGTVLDAATAISVDMAQALGGAPKDSAIQLGKALNDPIAGISALSRVGVTFDAQQKAQIKTMQDAGNVAGAQGIILKELNKEFGGSAAAAAGATGGISQLKGMLGEFGESIGAAVLPGMQALTGFLTSPDMLAAIQSVGDTIAHGVGDAMTWLTTTAIPALIAGWQSIAPTISTVVTAFQDAASYIGTDGIGAAISTLGADLGELNPAIGAAIQSFVPFVDTIMAVGAALLDASSYLNSDGFGAALSTMGADIAEVNPVLGAFIQGLAPIGDALQTVSTGLANNGAQWAAIQDTITQVSAGVTAVVMAVFGQIAVFLQAHGTEIQATIQTAWTQIQGIIQTAIQIIQATIVPALAAIASFIQAHGTEIQAVLSAVWTTISTIISTTLAVIQGVLTATLQIIQGDWSGAWATIQATVQTVMSAISTIVQAQLSAIQTVFASAWEAIKTAVFNALNSLSQGVMSALNSMAQTIFSTLNSVAGTAASQAAAIGAGIISGIAGAILGRAGEIANAAASAVTGAIDAAKAAVGIHSPSSVAAEEIGVPFVEGIVAGIERATPALTTSTASLHDSLMAFFDDFGDAGTILGDAFEKLPPQIQGVVEDISNTLGEQGIGALENYLNGFDAYLSQLPEDVQGFVKQLRADLNTIPDDVQQSTQAITDALQVQQQSAEDLGPEIGQLGGVVDETGTTVQDTVQAIQDGVPNAEDAGHDLALGVKSGMSSVHDELVDYAHHLVQDMIDEMRSTAQAASPSQATADNVGAPMAQGIAAGMESESGNLNESASTLVSDSVDAMAGSVSTLDDVGIPMMQGTIDGLIGMLPDLEKAIGKISKDSQDAFKQWLDDVHKLIDESFQSIIDQANDLFSAVGNAAKMFDSQRYADDVAAGYDKIAQLQDELTQNTTDQQAAQEALTAATQQYNQDQQDLIALQDQQKQNAKELADAQQKQTDLENQKAVLQAQIDSGQIDEATGKAQMKALDKQIAAQNDVVNAAQKAYNDTQKQIADTQKDITEQQQIQKDSQKDINTLLDEQRKKQEEYNTQLEKNNDLLYQQNALRQVQESEMSQIQAAQEEAAKIADPTEAAKYLQIQLDFYEKYYDLQAQMIKAGDNTQQIEYLKQQQALLVQAHEATLEQFHYEQETTKSTAEDVAAGTTATSKDAATRKTLDELNNTIGNLNNILAKGIEVTVTQGHASGTEYAPGGWSWVGEKGPELMYVPQGSQIYAHGDSPGGGGTSYSITVDARGASDPQAIEAAGYRGAKRALEEVGATAQIRKRAR